LSCQGTGSPLCCANTGHTNAVNANAIQRQRVSAVAGNRRKKYACIIA